MSNSLWPPWTIALHTPLSEISQVRILEWVANPFSRESSWVSDQTQVSCIAGGFFTISATREALILKWYHLFIFSYSPMRSLVLWTQMLFPTLSVPNISFPLSKILQGIKESQNFIDKHNCTLIVHSVITTIAANKLIDVGVDVQKQTSRSWDFFFTKFPTAQKLFSALFNPYMFLWSLCFYWLSGTAINIWFIELRRLLILFCFIPLLYSLNNLEADC